MSESEPPTTQGFADILVRVRPGRDGVYPVEAELDDGSRPVGELRLDERALLAASLDAQAYGLALFEALFAGQIGRAYEKATGRAATTTGGRLRVRLWIEPGASELQAIAWERLYHYPRGRPVPLAASDVSPFSRYTDLDAPDPAPVLTRPVRIAFVLANPEGLPPGLARIDVPGEVAAFHRALQEGRADGQFDLTVLPGRSAVLPAELTEALERDGYRVEEGASTIDDLVRLLTRNEVVHFFGHGTFQRGDGEDRGTVLHLEDDDGGWAPVPDRDIMARVAPMDPPAPHLVFLSACQTAPRDQAHAFVGLGPKLVEAGVPAVVAMQSVFPMDLARDLTLDFYRNLATHGLVDVALNQARLLLLDRNRSDWATPVLFSRLEGGRLFLPSNQANRGHGEETSLLPDPDLGVAVERAVSRSKPVSRRPPVLVLPAPFAGLLGREQEVARATTSLEGGEPVGFYASAGGGKTSLLHHLAHLPLPAAVEGVVHLDAAGWTVDDILQYLFGSLYEADPQAAVSDPELRRYLQGRSVVFVLDDANLSREDLQRLMSWAPRCRFVVAGEQRNLWEGQAIELDGLPVDSCLELFERELGSAVPAELRPVAEDLCRALRGHPLHVLQAAALARKIGADGPALGEIAASSSPAEALHLQLGQTLTPDEQRVLGVLAALGGAPIRPERLEELVGMGDALVVLESLRRQGLARSHSPTFRVAEPLEPEVRARLEADGWKARLLEYLAEWAPEHAAAPGLMAENADTLVAASRLAGDDQDLPRSIGLSQAAESGLIVTGRWGAWKDALDTQLGMARAIGDGAAEGRALHQLGSRALSLQDFEAAERLLRSALEIRQALGDEAGATLTRENMKHLRGGAAGEPPEKPEPPPKPRWRTLRLYGAVLGIAAVVGAAAFGIVRLLPDEDNLARSEVSLSPDEVRFPDLQIGRSASRDVTLSNTGRAPLTLSEGVFDPPLDALSLETDCPGELPEGGECTVRITFAPSTAGPLEADLVVASDAPGSPHRVRLLGAALAPPGVPALGVDPAALDFGSVQLPAEPVSLPLTVLSAGTEALEIGDVRIEPDTGVFGLDPTGCRGRSLDPDDRCTVTVSFGPVDRGPATGELVIEANTPESPLRIPLTGVGVVGKADLVVTKFEQIDAAVVNEAGAVEVPVGLVVENVGDAAAVPFKVSVDYFGGRISPESTFVVALRADPTDAIDPGRGFYPMTRSDVPPGGEVEITGRLIFTQGESDAVVTATALADSCAGEEFAPDFCRVDEIEETNNRSSSIEIALPALPDLVPLDLTAEGVLVQNLGAGAAGPFTVDVFQSGEFEGSFQVPGLDPGGETTIDFGTCFSTSNLEVVIDPNGVVPETDETNNRTEASTFCD